MNDDLICDEEVESAHQIKRNVSSREDVIYKSKYFNFYYHDAWKRKHKHSEKKWVPNQVCAFLPNVLSCKPGNLQ